MGLFGKMLEYPGKPLIMSGTFRASPFVCNKPCTQRERLRASRPSLFGDSLVQIEDDAGHSSPGRQLPNVQFAVEFGFTYAQQPLRGLRIMMISGHFAFCQIPQNLPL